MSPPKGRISIAAKRKHPSSEADKAISLKAMGECSAACQMGRGNAIVPMILCRLCDRWLHYRCVGLPDVGMASTLRGSYVCEDCVGSFEDTLANAVEQTEAGRHIRTHQEAEICRRTEALDGLFLKFKEQYAGLRMLLKDYDIRLQQPPSAMRISNKGRGGGRSQMRISSSSERSSGNSYCRPSDGRILNGSSEESDLLPIEFGAHDSLLLCPSFSGAPVKGFGRSGETKKVPDSSDLVDVKLNRIGSSQVSPKARHHSFCTDVEFNQEFIASAGNDSNITFRKASKPLGQQRRTPNCGRCSTESYTCDEFSGQSRKTLTPRRKCYDEPEVERSDHFLTNHDCVQRYSCHADFKRRRLQDLHSPCAPRHVGCSPSPYQAHCNMRSPRSILASQEEMLDSSQRRYERDAPDVDLPLTRMTKVHCSSSNSARSDNSDSAAKYSSLNTTGQSEIASVSEWHTGDEEIQAPFFFSSESSNDCSDSSTPNKIADDDDEIIEDDFFLYCNQCSKSYLGDCHLHPMIRIHDTIVSKDDPHKAINTLPPGFLIRESSLPCAGLGAWADMDIAKGVVIGPYGGTIAYDSHDTCDSNYCWQIVQTLQPSYCVNGKDIASSNWLRYINCANHYDQQNLTAFQFKGNIFYRTIKNVTRGTELLVWYGKEYAEQLGLASPSSKRQCKRINAGRHGRPAVARKLKEAKGIKHNTGRQLPLFTTSKHWRDISSNDQAPSKKLSGDVQRRTSKPGDSRNSESSPQIKKVTYGAGIHCMSLNNTCDLQQHVEKVHIASRKIHRCTACLAEFFTSKELKLHSSTLHKGTNGGRSRKAASAKAFCEACSLRFISKALLIQHQLRKHNGLRGSHKRRNEFRGKVVHHGNFTCGTCCRPFKTACARDKHMKLQHARSIR